MRTRRVIGIALAVYLAVPVVKGDADDPGTLAFAPVPDRGPSLASIRPADVVPRRAGDPPRLIASSDKIKRELGWKPQFQDLIAIIGSAYAQEGGAGAGRIGC
jgi:hypothetical protein